MTDEPGRIIRATITDTVHSPHDGTVEITEEPAGEEVVLALLPPMMPLTEFARVGQAIGAAFPGAVMRAREGYSAEVLYRRPPGGLRDDDLDDGPVTAAAEALRQSGYVDVGQHDDVDDWREVVERAVLALRTAGWTVTEP